MQVLLLTNSDLYSLPLIYKLQKENLLSGIGLTDGAGGKVLENDFKQIDGIDSSSIYPISKAEQSNDFSRAVEESGADVVLVLSWPYILPDDVLEYPQHGIFNIHFGLLPEEKGSDPIFWAIKNGSGSSGITIHKMTSVLDEGPIVLKEKIEIFPMDSYGSLASRMAYNLSLLIDTIFPKIENKVWTEIDTAQSKYLPKVSDQDLIINWEKMTSSEIIWLIQASNPRYKGASTLLGNSQVRIYEAELANINQPPVVSAGTIIHSDQMYGIIVMCSDFKCIRLSIIQMNEGFVSGTRLFYMGVKPGEKFNTIRSKEAVEA